MWRDAAAGGTHCYTMAGGICGNNSVTGGGEDDIPDMRWGDIVPEMQWQYC
jgi:sulfite exporter TauE/SafE